MNSILSHTLTFVGGVIAKWFQGTVQERKKEWSSLREGILRPIREQVYSSIPNLESGDRVTSVDLDQWNRIVASGRDREIPDQLRSALEQLYKTDLPTHDRAWLVANDEVERVMELADRNFGGARAGASLPSPPWRKFLARDAFDPAIVGWQSGHVRIWNRELEDIKLLPLRGSREDLLRRIWTEGQMRAPFPAYQATRLSALGNAKHCLGLLDAVIDGGLARRVSKHFRKIPL